MCQGPSSSNNIDVRKAVEDRRYAEEVVTVAVCDVHMGESLIRVSILDPVGKSGGLGGGEKGIDEDGFVG